MRVVQFKRSRVIKFLILGLTALVAFIMVVKSMGREKDFTDILAIRQSLLKGSQGGRQRHISHPGEIPVFKGKGNKGNFEPESYAGGDGAGDGGKAHKLRVEQKDEEERLKGVYGFNQLVSDEISLNRTVPDTREEECKWWDYPTSLPTASVVLVFHNEGWSTLFRTVHSVINRSPPQFLHEVVLVDDKSELEHLHEKLDETLKLPYYKKEWDS